MYIHQYIGNRYDLLEGEWHGTGQKLIKIYGGDLLYFKSIVAHN